MVGANSSDVAPNVISIFLEKNEESGLGFLVKERQAKPHAVVSDIIKGKAATLVCGLVSCIRCNCLCYFYYSVAQSYAYQYTSNISVS